MTPIGSLQTLIIWVTFISEVRILETANNVSLDVDSIELLQHAAPRWSDSSYVTRIIISYLIQDDVLGETAFGIYTINDINQDLGEQTVIIDFVNKTVTDIHPVTWDNFIQAYSPQLTTI